MPGRCLADPGRSWPILGNLGTQWRLPSCHCVARGRHASERISCRRDLLRRSFIRKSISNRHRNRIGIHPRRNVLQRGRAAVNGRGGALRAVAVAEIERRTAGLRSAAAVAAYSRVSRVEVQVVAQLVGAEPHSARGKRAAESLAVTGNDVDGSVAAAD
jgi:hypothetical protein